MFNPVHAFFVPLCPHGTLRFITAHLLARQIREASEFTLAITVNGFRSGYRVRAKYNGYYAYDARSFSFFPIRLWMTTRRSSLEIILARVSFSPPTPLHPPYLSNNSAITTTVRHKLRAVNKTVSSLYNVHS